MVKGKEFCFGCRALPENRQRGFLLVLSGAVSQPKLKKEIADHITFINSPLGLCCLNPNSPHWEDGKVSASLC